METCQGPRQHVTPPRLAVPPLSCDCHSHILGPTDRYPYVPSRSFTPPDASPADYLAMLGALGIERMVVVQPSVYGSDNRCTADAVVALGIERARGVAMVDQTITLAELKVLEAKGIRATRFITTAGGGPSLDDLPEVARKVAEAGWHIEMYVPVERWPDLLPIVAELPVPVVFDHMGGVKAGRGRDDPTLSGILKLLAAGRHWVKLCGYRNSVAGYPYSDVGDLARTFIAEAADRCVWGTDWPHTSIPGYMPDDGELLDLLADWAPNAATRDKILVDNPAALYRFD